MRLLYLIGCMLISMSCFSTEVQELVIFHQSINEPLVASDKSAIEKFYNGFDGQIIEKVNIYSYSLDYAQTKVNGALSEQRLQAIYNEILNYMEEDNNIEKFNLNTVATHPKNAVSYSRIEIYLLEDMGKSKVTAIEKVLFPEDFIELSEDTYIPESYSKDTSFNIRDVQFHGNSAVFKKNSEETIKDLENFLRINPELNIRIVGHVNGKLSKAYLKKASKHNPERWAYQSSEDLSLARAITIRKYLVAQGIDSDRIEVEGKGAQEMKFKTPKTKKEEAANRRIEVIIL